MPVITRRLEFDYGHRLLRHEGKCRNVHGHRGVVEATISAPELDEVGRVLDFGAVKELLGGWLDAMWDHGFIVQKGDPLHLWLLEHKQKHYVLEVPPTAEHLVDHFAVRAQQLLDDAKTGVTLVRARFWETPNSCADWAKS